jgi:Zn-finger nucleic acid-binding protein
MNCPKCTATMEQVSFEGVIVDRCSRCAGLWLDPVRISYLKNLEGSEVVDSGLVESGERNDAITKLTCPRCNIAMNHQADPDQPHIHFESCPRCHCLFLDAGEFTDLKFHTFADYFRDLFAKREENQ